MFFCIVEFFFLPKPFFHVFSVDFFFKLLNPKFDTLEAWTPSVPTSWRNFVTSGGPKLPGFLGFSLKEAVVLFWLLLFFAFWVLESGSFCYDLMWSKHVKTMYLGCICFGGFGLNAVVNW